MLRSLANHGLTVFAVCNSAAGQAAHSRYCAGAWTLDRGPQAKPAAEQVEELARELNVGSIMPIAEGHHLALIQRREQLEPHVHLFSPAAGAFEKATDKDSLHRQCLDLGIPVAKGTTLDVLMRSGADTLRYPLVLRTRRQMGPGGTELAPWKAAYACNQLELDALYQDVADYADNVLVQEYHPGVEAHIQILMHRGEAFMTGGYVGEDHMPLAGGVTVRRVTCRHEAMRSDAVNILQAIGWEGIAAVQFHYDPATDRYILLEINPRFCGGLPTVIMAGFDAPRLLWQSHFEPEAMRKTPYRLGLRTRILGGHANWLLAMLRRDPMPPDQQHLGRLHAIARFAWHCGPWTKDDCFSWSDPKPYFVDLKQMIRRRLLRRDAEPLSEDLSLGTRSGEMTSATTPGESTHASPPHPEPPIP